MGKKTLLACIGGMLLSAGVAASIISGFNYSNANVAEQGRRGRELNQQACVDYPSRVDYRNQFLFSLGLTSFGGCLIYTSRKKKS